MTKSVSIEKHCEAHGNTNETFRLDGREFCARCVANILEKQDAMVKVVRVEREHKCSKCGAEVNILFPGRLCINCSHKTKAERRIPPPPAKRRSI